MNEKIIHDLFSDVCSLMLNFEIFTISGPMGSQELDGGLCSIDAFQISGIASATSMIPIICGENSGMHGKSMNVFI